MDLILVLKMVSLIIFLRASSASECHATSFKINGLEYNVNHLKNHLPPYQKYDDKSNLFGASSSSPKEYVFFNIADIIHKQKIDGHQITSRCLPRTKNIDTLTNFPVACIPADKRQCDSKDVCWIALGSCKNVTYELVNEDLIFVYKNGDFPDKKFAVKINCCRDPQCLSQSGLDSPIKLKSSDCYQKADFCVEFNSPYGCDCETRRMIDHDLKKSEFQCDATPHGLSKGLSTGSWLLIFFFTIMGMYFGVGVAYNCSDGHRGIEAIPHLEMWKDIGALIYEGFTFIRTSGTYRDGIQYDSI